MKHSILATLKFPATFFKNANYSGSAYYDNAALNTVEQKSLWFELAKFEYMPNSGITGS